MLVALTILVQSALSAGTTTCDLTGTWNTDFGKMVITQSGSTVHGEYDHDAGRLDGTMSGKTLTGRWSESPSYKGPGDAGGVVLTISDNCASFTGTWGYDQASSGSGWSGTKTSGPLVATTTTAAASATGTIVGSWDWSWGTGRHVTLNAYADGTADWIDETGTRTNTGKWQQQGNVFVFTSSNNDSIDTVSLSSDGQKITGTNNYGNPLTGIRKTGIITSGPTAVTTVVTAKVPTAVTTKVPTTVTTKETTAVTTTAAAASATGTIVGAWDWSWGTGRHVTLNVYAGGTADVVDETGTRTNTGKWQQQGNVFVFTWSNNDSIDTVSLSSDGQKITGTNNYGNPLTGIRKTGTITSGPTGVTSAVTTTKAVSSGSGTTVTSHCSGSGPSIYVENRIMNPGQEVVIPIMMCNANDITNMDLSVGYDSSALQFKDAIKGSLNSNMLFESNNVGSTVKISFAGKSGFSGSGSIAILTFKVTGQNGASSPITVTVGSASTSGGKSVTVPVNNGNVVIGNTNPNNPGGRDKVTSLDALIALQISVGKRVNDSNYDLTKDGTVNSNDAREILKLAVQ
ncbi:MAG: hypothetical protein WCP36_07660 [Methanomicrobiales archaeon]